MAIGREMMMDQPVFEAPKPPYQYRPGPTTKPDNRVYAPQRDLAYLFPAAVREAFSSLDKDNWMGYYAPILKAYGITEEMLAEGVRRFVSAFQFFVGDPDVKTFDDALERTDFFQVNSLVRIMIFERIGEVMTVGFFMAVRDVSRFGENPPQMMELADMAKAIHGFVRRLNGDSRQEIFPATAVDELLATQAVLKTTQRSLDNQRKLTQEAEQTVNQLRVELRAEQRLGFWRKFRRMLGGK
jgi:hypothetical protein